MVQRTFCVWSILNTRVSDRNGLTAYTKVESTWCMFKSTTYLDCFQRYSLQPCYFNGNMHYMSCVIAINFWVAYMQFSWKKIEISAFYAALISNLHIVSEVKALQIASISSLLEEYGIFPKSSSATKRPTHTHTHIYIYMYFECVPVFTTHFGCI